MLTRDDLRDLLATVTQYYKTGHGEGFAFDGTDPELWTIACTGMRTGASINVRSEDLLTASRCSKESLHNMITILLRQVERAHPLYG